MFGGEPVGGCVFMCCLSAERDEKPQDGQTIFRLSVHYTDATIEYLNPIFNVVQQQMRNYIVAMPEVLSYLTTALTSVRYVEPTPNASKHVDYLTCTRKSLHSCIVTA